MMDWSATRQTDARTTAPCGDFAALFAQLNGAPLPIDAGLATLCASIAKFKREPVRDE